MIKHEFCDHCPGCRPVILDDNGKPVPDDHQGMKLLNYVWDNNTTYAMRKAFIEVTLHNSQDKTDRELALVVLERFTSMYENCREALRKGEVS